MIPSDARLEPGQILLIYDGTCGICSAFARRMQRLDWRRRLAWQPSQAAGLREATGLSQADTAAAAVCWLIGNANELFHPRTVPHLLAKTLIAHFGLAPATVTQRSKAILRAAGAPPTEQTGAVELGSPGYLVAARRARIIADRDRYRAMAT